MPGQSFRNAKLYKKSAVKSPRAKKVMSARRTKPTLVQRVQRIISQNVENKFTDSITQVRPIMTVTEEPGEPNYFQYYTWAPGGNAVGAQMFDLTQGTAQNQRVGNTIKLKRWVIKGLIQPNIDGLAAPLTATENSYIGYVDVFFGRLLNNNTAIDGQLIDLYQAGNGAITPNATAGTILYPINKDKYKIYWRKRFKMGNSFSVGFPAAPQTTNNDFSLARTFGFDVTKYILKNKHIKYEDGDTTPNDDMIENLTVFATFYPVVGNVPVNDLGRAESFYALNVQSYAEYEDA